MDKYSRNQRVAIITKTLIENPNKVINLNLFTELFNAAKSTVSEDILIVRETLEKLQMGKVDTISGAAGGIKYMPTLSKKDEIEFVEKLCMFLKNRDRIIPGNYLYMTDIMYNPTIIGKAGIMLASRFYHMDLDYVVTVETKGIPLAYEVAKCLGLQLVIVRRDTKVTEGTTVSINYVSGSNKRIQSMSLSKRLIKKGSKCLFIDDFMKAGGTARGIIELLKEFDSELLGIGIFVDQIGIEEKIITDYTSIIELEGIDEEGNCRLVPSKCFKR